MGQHDKENISWKREEHFFWLLNRSPDTNIRVASCIRRIRRAYRIISGSTTCQDCTNGKIPHVAIEIGRLQSGSVCLAQRLYEKGKTMGSPFPEVEWSRLLPGATSFFEFSEASNDRGDLRKQRKSQIFYNDPIARINFLIANISVARFHKR